MLIDLFYKEEKERTIINFPRVFSPFDLGLFPLVNKDKLPKKAEEIKEMLKNDGLKIFYDNSGSIGRRYRRMDEIGVSLSVTVDHQTLKNNTVTIRNRDTMKQIRVKIDNLSKVIKNIINCKTDFKKAGKIVK